MNLLILLCKVESKTNHFKFVTLGLRGKNPHIKKTRLVFASINRHHSRVTDRQTVKKQKDYEKTIRKKGLKKVHND